MISTRIKFLDGIRFILALWVVLGHFYTLTGGIKFYAFNAVIQNILLRPIVAVYGFIILTGFLMMHNYLLRETKEPANSKSTFIKFYLRRFFRLYPLYIILLFISFFTFKYISAYAANNLIFFTGSNVTQFGFVRSTIQPSYLDLGAHILLLQGLLPNLHAILGVTWSLSLEMQFYFLFPFLFLLFFWNKNSLKIRVPIFILTCALVAFISPKVMHHFFTQHHLPDYREPSIILYTMPLFLVGMVMAGVKHKKLNKLYLFIVLIVTMPFQLVLTNVLTCFILILLFLEEIESVLPAFVFKFLSFVDLILSGKIAEFGANISYSLYLIHTTVISFVLTIAISNAQLFNNSKPLILITSLIITLAICLCICFFLYTFIEKPFILLGKNLINKISLKRKVGTNQEAMPQS